MIQTLITFELDGHSIDYVPPYYTRDIYCLSVDILSRDWTDAQRITAVASWCAAFCASMDAVQLIHMMGASIYELATHMVHSSALGPKIHDVSALLKGEAQIKHLCALCAVRATLRAELSAQGALAWALKLKARPAVRSP